MYKWYHASPKRFTPGKILGQPYEYGVFVTNSFLPHSTIINQAVSENWYIYEVEPITVHCGYSLMNQDAMFLSARVVRCVGRAKGMKVPHSRPDSVMPQGYPMGSFIKKDVCKKYKHAVKNARARW